MAFTKPNRVARFGGTSSTETTNSTEPSSGKKDTGWVLDDEPPSSFFNWLHYRYYQWLRWFDERSFDGATVLDWLLQGVDAGAGTDLQGGDLTLSGGQATGDGSSVVEIKAATRGAAGASTRTPESYIQCNGDTLAGPTERGAILVSKKLAVGLASGDADAAEIATLGTGHALAIGADITSPAKSALAITPQDADPSTAPANGDVYVNSDTDQLAHYSAALGRFQSVDSVVEQTVVDSAAIADTVGPAQFNQGHTIPADTLRVGSVVRVKAWGEYAITGSPTLQIGAQFGTGAAVGVAGDSRNADGDWSLELELIVRTIGAGGTYSAAQTVRYSEAPVASTVADFFLGAANGSEATDAAIDVEITVTWSVASASNTITMQGFVVEVL
jgi:hypothetical protein